MRVKSRLVVRTFGIWPQVICLFRWTFQEKLANVFDRVLLFHRRRAEDSRAVFIERISRLWLRRTWPVRPLRSFGTFKVAAVGVQNIVRFRFVQNYRNIGTAGLREVFKQ